MELKHMLSFPFIAMMLFGIAFFTFVAYAPETKPEVVLQQYIEQSEEIQTFKNWLKTDDAS